VAVGVVGALGGVPKLDGPGDRAISRVVGEGFGGVIGMKHAHLSVLRIVLEPGGAAKRILAGGEISGQTVGVAAGVPGTAGFATEVVLM